MLGGVEYKCVRRAKLCSELAASENSYADLRIPPTPPRKINSVDLRRKGVRTMQQARFRLRGGCQEMLNSCYRSPLGLRVKTCTVIQLVRLSTVSHYTIGLLRGRNLYPLPRCIRYHALRPVANMLTMNSLPLKTLQRESSGWIHCQSTQHLQEYFLLGISINDMV